MLDLAAPPGAPRQQTLHVRLLRPGFALTPENIRITGGERIPEVGVVWAAAADALPAEAEPGLVDTVDPADLALTLVIRTDSAGDFSTYTLAIFANSGSEQPPAGFDPVLSRIEFSFKVECPSPYDCAEAPACPPELRDLPAIDYLAKDYQGFRRLMLDRLSLLVPGWTERSAADLGVALVELLAYAADKLSYRQDVIASEAYLATARQRSLGAPARPPGRLLHARGLQRPRLRALRGDGPGRRVAATHAAADARARPADRRRARQPGAARRHRRWRARLRDGA